MFSCLSRNTKSRQNNQKLNPKKPKVPNKIVSQKIIEKENLPQQNKIYSHFKQHKQINETYKKESLKDEAIQKYEQAKNIQQQDVRKSKQQKNSITNNQHIMNSKKNTNTQENQRICKQQQPEKIDLNQIEFKIQTDKSLSSYGILFQQIQQDLRHQIILAISQLTKTHSLFKRTQSSLEGMKKDILQQSIQEQIQIQDEQQQTNNDLNQEFSKKLIQRDFQQAQKIFKKMKKAQKNGYDQKGYTPLYVSTLISILDGGKSIDFLKRILRDQQVNVCQKVSTGSKPIQQAVIFKSIPTLTNIFRVSYINKLKQIKYCLKQLCQFFLQNIDDFSLQINVKVASFLPLVQKIAPDDTIKIYKKGQSVRIDYTLVGYTFLQSKRRNMSCIIKKIQNQQYTIIAINHDKKCFTNLLQPFEDQQLVLLIEDILSTEIKRTDPRIQNSQINQQRNIFNQVCQQRIDDLKVIKHQLKVLYTSQTQKIKPCSKNAKRDLKFLQKWDDYLIYSPTLVVKKKKKQMNLGLWICNQYPLKLQQIVQIFKILSYIHEGGSVIFNFFVNQNIQNKIDGFPIKLEIPISFSLYLEIKMSKLKLETPKVQFDYQNQYRKQKRSQFQKTLKKRQKRLTLIKLYM